ncbi:Flp/Fap pilin component [Devosia sp. LC5]|uniref:Flp family type IVb pilin n=1 Tax=Devosia sp. LC5 TaxID=1502724 RepID=UPI0004E33AD5|nr:Flp family type IVb pilin [Devosia sp. LC5]KFC61802.1 Flp/Fap pilin component [Devosia sp. LC5]
MTKALLHFLRDETGATAIEYGLLAGLIAVALMVSFALLGESITALFGVGAGSAATIIGEAADSIP